MTRRPRFMILLWVLPILLALAVLGSGLLGEGPLPFGRAQPPPGVTLTDLHDIGDLQTTFNQACRRILASNTRWTVVRGSDLEEGESQGLPVWSRHVGDPVLKSNITRRVDFALFMVAPLTNDELVHEAPAIVGCRTPSAIAHARVLANPARVCEPPLPSPELGASMYLAPLAGLRAG